MADNKEYQAVLTIDGDQNTESLQVAKEGSTRGSDKIAQEEIELVQEPANDGENGAADSGNQDEASKQKANMEDLLLRTIEEKDYYEIKGKLTAKAIINFGENPLLLAIKITEKLHNRANKEGPDRDDFTELANRVEEFTLRILDPLKYHDVYRLMFSANQETSVILETAIKLGQKKFFDHPIVIDLMNKRWYGGGWASKAWWLILSLWCLVDVVFFPIVFFLAFVSGRVASCIRRARSNREGGLSSQNESEDEIGSKSLYDRYNAYFQIPYFIFVRDTLSYLALVGLHLAICLEPSQLSFSGLEWAILTFLVGRLLMEITQIESMARKREKVEKMTLTEAIRNYLRDRWNMFDLAIVIIFFCAIFPVRIVTWAVSESIANNRAILIAGYFYGFNTMLLTVRVFGSILETFEGVGTIQIALFHIIRDAVVVVLHFAAITLAFSSTITKVFVAETSMLAKDADDKHPMCNYNKPGILCWWKIATQLGWSLLDLSDGLGFFKSSDSLSETIAYLLYAAYLVMALILLINMLIALLSNTYQRVQDNSRKEWAFQKAITIQTYCNYHPVPVPFNIISIIAMRFRKKDTADEGNDKFISKYVLDYHTRYLLDKYRLKYGDSFPPTDKLEQVLDDTENTESMVNQVLYRSFNTKKGLESLFPTGPKAWPELHDDILVEGCLLTCLRYSVGDSSVVNQCGARYCLPFDSDTPHFEVMLLESGETKWLALGAVYAGYGTGLYPGWERTVGYCTDTRKIYSGQLDPGPGQKTIQKGSAAARRGDVIRCTLVFEEKQETEIDGNFRVPVVFSENGSRIIPEGDQNQTYVTYSEDRPLYPYIAFEGQNRVLAKLCEKDEGPAESLLVKVKMDTRAICEEFVNVKKDVARQSSQIQEVSSELAVVKEKLDAALKSEIESKLAEINRSLGEKLDAVLRKIGEKDADK